MTVSLTVEDGKHSRDRPEKSPQVHIDHVAPVVDGTVLERASRAAPASLTTASMQAIGRTAGVGQGAIYRHFPTRSALLVEVYQKDFHRLVHDGETIAAVHPPDLALRKWLDVLATFGRKKHALADALDEALDSQLHSEQTTSCATV